MIGNKVVHRLMMTGGDGHYVNQLVNGSRMLDFFGDVATELLVRADGDLSLFLGYEEVRFTAPIHVGDFMEYHGWIEKKGKTSYKVKFEAYKVITMPDDFKHESYMLDYRILLEADWLVNNLEYVHQGRDIYASYEIIFRTETGKRIFNDMFPKE